MPAPGKGWDELRDGTCHVMVRDGVQCLRQGRRWNEVRHGTWRVTVRDGVLGARSACAFVRHAALHPLLPPLRNGA